jgi:hypothetical protein
MSNSDLTFGVEAADVYREIVNADGEVVRVERLSECPECDGLGVEHVYEGFTFIEARPCDCGGRLVWVEVEGLPDD